MKKSSITTEDVYMYCQKYITSSKTVCANEFISCQEGKRTS